MKKVHERTVELRHTYDTVRAWLSKHGEVRLQTARGTPFEARASVCQGGDHPGQSMILITRDGDARAYIYPCCWGHSTQCGGTRIGMYSNALEAAMV